VGSYNHVNHITSLYRQKLPLPYYCLHSPSGQQYCSHRWNHTLPALNCDISGQTLRRWTLPGTFRPLACGRKKARDCSPSCDGSDEDAALLRGSKPRLGPMKIAFQRSCPLDDSAASKLMGVPPSRPSSPAFFRHGGERDRRERQRTTSARNNLECILIENNKTTKTKPISRVRSMTIMQIRLCAPALSVS
jgi:hypothetical protein